jgi:tetratricopeptide (TPR) repeat protein
MLADRAQEAGDGCRYREAVDLLMEARAVEDRPGLALRQGIYLLKLRDFRAAMTAFDAASKKSHDGQAERLGAFCATQDGDMDRAEEYLARALDLPITLELLDEIEGDEAFKGVLARPTLREALNDARERFSPENR